MTITINGTTGIAGVDGSAATPSVQGVDTNTGMFFPAADTIAFAEGGTEVMRINSSGNVGIGTSSPVGRFEVYSDANSTQQTFVRNFNSGSSAFSVFNVGNDASSTAFRMLVGSTTATAWGGAESANLVNSRNSPMTFWINNTERMRIDSSGNLLFNSGYGSVATAYGCRAWVNFNGTGTVAIRASGNVTSITDNGAGDYTVNFTTTLPDVNYSCVCSGSQADFASVNHAFSIYDVFAPTTSSVRLINQSSNGGNADLSYANVAIFR